ncbi:MAG: hypothetical protein AVDCRST_MAG13-22, partial [uncultured Solirubrobacteraceae bacterium]
ERGPELPVLRGGRGGARGPVGRADHHRPVALRGVLVLLRGRPGGLRRPRPGGPAGRGRPGRRV